MFFTRFFFLAGFEFLIFITSSKILRGCVLESLYFVRNRNFYRKKSPYLKFLIDFSFPKLLWVSGVVLFFLMMGAAFTSYSAAWCEILSVSPWGLQSTQCEPILYPKGSHWNWDEMQIRHLKRGYASTIHRLEFSFGAADTRLHELPDGRLILQLLRDCFVTERGYYQPILTKNHIDIVMERSNNPVLKQILLDHIIKKDVEVFVFSDLLLAVEAAHPKLGLTEYRRFILDFLEIVKTLPKAGASL